ncbi:SPOR domain-containing protein [Sphingomonas sp.]|uniref:SPOR domain-containing protein n=1 Tax=Sphingomonas sp. TaxID=28214 RepID=UPI001D905C1A|nr:SPOR domain-containing protein [Sphingomonas sp.]MBX9796425.1 SPOR domain-containing protein [Sphingomonas sp.]
MLKPFGIALPLLLALSATPSLADVKAGVDAWQRGDYRRAIEEWRPLAVAGDADAQFNLGQAYKLGRGVPVDPALAEQWFGKAAAQGHPQAETNYALALFQNGKHAEAVPWLEKSAGRGDPRGQLVLGTMLFNGDSVQKDWVRAYALMVRASSTGLPKASETLGQMDQYIPTDVRQRGLELARQYEAQSQSPQLSYELAGGTTPGPRGTELPPSTASTEAQPGVKPPRVATTAPPPPVATRQVPPPRPAPVATITPAPAPATGGKWRVQLGAFGEEGNARRLWEQLRGRVSALGAMQPYLVRSGALTRLQAGPLANAAAAAKLCGQVRAATGGACVPVAP